MAKKKRKPRLNGSLKGTVERMAKAKGVTLPPAPWDTGASGPAARARPAVIEDAIDADPETGEVRNPNGVKRLRIVDMLEVWLKRGVISTAGYNFAVRLRDTFEATLRAPGWPDNDRVQASPNHGASAMIRIRRLSAFHAVSRHIDPVDAAIIGFFVLKAGDADYRGAKYKPMLEKLGPALDRAAVAMEQPERARRMWGKIIG